MRAPANLDFFEKASFASWADFDRWINMENGFSGISPFHQRGTFKSLNHLPQVKSLIMFSSLATGIFLFVVVWACCRPLRQLFVKSELDNVPGPDPDSLLQGNLGTLFNPHSGWSFLKQISKTFGRVVRIYGAFGSKHLYVYDVKAIHAIIIKDEDFFQESPAFFAFNYIAFGGGLLSTHGEIHKRQRKMVHPVFSTNHIRNMVPIFDDVAKKLETTIAAKLADGPREVDILHWTGRAALEIIGQSAFGHSFDSLAEAAEAHPFGIAAKEFSPATDDLLFLREYALPTLIKIGPPRFRRFMVDHLPWKTLHRLRDVIDTMDHVTTHLFEQKKKALALGDDSCTKHDAKAKDLMTILMRANMSATKEDRLADKEVLAQMSTIAFAGTDTTSNIIARTLHLLSHRLEVQDKLRNEINQALGGHLDRDDIPYSELMSLPFLDAVCRETLRLYPPLTFVTRVATKDSTIPLSTPIQGLNGRHMDSIMVPTGTKVFVSIYDVNRDRALWGPDSSKWRPERWLSPLPHALLNAHVPGIYSHLMTFLGGPRACIGSKFLEVEMKVVLARLMSRFFFSPCEKEIIWEMTGISTPTVKGFPGKPQLPITMKLV